jgi:curli production assembly/transport component CsgE
MHAHIKHAALGLLLACALASSAANASRASNEASNQHSEQAAKLPDPDASAKRLLTDPLGGMVINHTVTVLGNDFYQYFANAWNEIDPNHKYTISIYERPTARWGSEVWVQFRNNRMFRTFLSPARQAAKSVSEQAAQITFKNIENSELQRLMFHSKDLGAEEF